MFGNMIEILKEISTCAKLFVKKWTIFHINRKVRKVIVEGGAASKRLRQRLSIFFCRGTYANFWTSLLKSGCGAESYRLKGNSEQYGGLTGIFNQHCCPIAKNDLSESNATGNLGDVRIE